MKFIAWSIVIFGWIIYGLIIIIPFLDPHPHDPMQDFYILFHPKPGDWIAIPFIILSLIAWYTAWDYLKGERNKKKHEIQTIQRGNGDKA